jgi:hypothetical protein
MAPTEGTLQYIGKVEKMWADGAGKVKVRSRWYYRPHEAKGGRRAVSYRVLACFTCISVQCEEDLENMVLAMQLSSFRCRACAPWWINGGGGPARGIRCWSISAESHTTHSESEMQSEFAGLEASRVPLNGQVFAP